MIPTTAVFAEILLIGFEAGVWLVLLLGAIFGKPALDVGSLEGWEALVTALVALAAYGLGVIVDRAADTTYSAVRDSRVGQRYVAAVFGKCPDFGQKPAKAGEMRMAILGQDDGRTRFLEYQRSRLRIARATAFNLLVLMPIGAWYLLVRTDIGIGVLWFEALVIAAFVGSVWASERIGDAFMDRLVDAYNMARAEPAASSSKKGKESERGKGPERKRDDEIDSKTSLEDSDSAGAADCQRAGAVCYRVRRGRVKFLLVTTKDEVKRWTFPKGRIEPQETAPQAASREAKEEAGAVGEVGPFVVRYRYPGGGAICREVSVDAYLLRVKKKVKPAKPERHRRRKWCTAAEAKRRLGCYRKKRFQEQHERVVDAAIARIAAPGD